MKLASVGTDAEAVVALGDAIKAHEDQHALATEVAEALEAELAPLLAEQAAAQRTTARAEAEERYASGRAAAIAFRAALDDFLSAMCAEIERHIAAIDAADASLGHAAFVLNAHGGAVPASLGELVAIHGGPRRRTAADPGALRGRKGARGGHRARGSARGGVEGRARGGAAARDGRTPNAARRRPTARGMTQHGSRWFTIDAFPYDKEHHMSGNSAVAFANKLAGAQISKDTPLTTRARDFTWTVRFSDGKKTVVDLASALAIAKAIDAGTRTVKAAVSVSETVALATRHVCSVEVGVAEPGAVKETQIGSVKFSDGTEMNVTSESIAAVISAMTGGDEGVEMVTIGSRQIVANVAQIVSAARPAS